MSEFGDGLKKLRAQRGLSQEQLADILGTSKQVISRYEKGLRHPKITVANDYASKLGVTLSDLSGGAHPVYNESVTDSEHDTRSSAALSDVYFRFAKEAEKSNIHPDDIKDAIEMIKRLRGGK